MSLFSYLRRAQLGDSPPPSPILLRILGQPLVPAFANTEGRPTTLPQQVWRAPEEMGPKPAAAPPAAPSGPTFAEKMSAAASALDSGQQVPTMPAGQITQGDPRALAALLSAYPSFRPYFGMGDR